MTDELSVDRLRELTESIVVATTERDQIWEHLKAAGDTRVVPGCNPETCISPSHLDSHHSLRVGDRRDGYILHGGFQWDGSTGPRPTLDVYNLHPARPLEIHSDHSMSVHAGVYELMYTLPFRRRLEHIFVRVTEPMAWDEVSHRKAASNLRARAARQGMRVRVRDREITLIDPMNTEILTGDVVEVSAWLLGIDLKAVAA